jgi:hypothetical protein
MRNKFTCAGAFLLVCAVLGLGCAGCRKQQAHAEGDGHDHGHKQSATPVPATVTGQPALGGVKCAAHSAPKELCFLCDASLRDKGRLWCAEHVWTAAGWLPSGRRINRLYCNELAFTRTSVSSAGGRQGRMRVSRSGGQP